MKEKGRWILASFMIAVGVMHFADPTPFVRIVPAYLPLPLALVYVSGFFEILGGVGLLIRPLSRAAAWGLIALYLAVFPANLNMALHKISLGDTPMPDWALWLRLPMQLLLIYWAWRYTKPLPEAPERIL
jgi:uncharacterized membrane protein